MGPIEDACVEARRCAFAGKQAQMEMMQQPAAWEPSRTVALRGSKALVPAAAAAAVSMVVAPAAVPHAPAAGADAGAAPEVWAMKGQAGGAQRAYASPGTEEGQEHLQRQQHRRLVLSCWNLLNVAERRGSTEEEAAL